MTSEFVKTLTDFDREGLSSRNIFVDFLTCASVAFANRIAFDKPLEERYEYIMKKYENKPAILKKLPELLGLLTIEHHEYGKPTDLLGGYYDELNYANDRTGQFFTPKNVATMMAQMMCGSRTQRLEDNVEHFGDIACGSGRLIMTYIETLFNKNVDFPREVCVTAIDIDDTCAMMTYVQMCLWNVAGVVFTGDALDKPGKFRQAYPTPAYFMYGHNLRIKELPAITAPTITAEETTELIKQMNLEM